MLNNFLLVGRDYWFSPAMDSINLLAEVNPELKGGAAFSIKSNRTFQVTLPYLIKTKSADGMSKEYLLQHPPKLLIAAYPEEIYLLLPKAKDL